MNDPLALYGRTQAAASDHERQWAWTDFYSHVMPYAIGWARRQPAFRHVGEWSYVMAHEGIARLWRGTGGGMKEFENSQQLMSYLRHCVRAAVIDAARTKIAWERKHRPRFHEVSFLPSAEEMVFEELETAERRAWLVERAKDEGERAWLSDEVFTAARPRHGAGARRAYRERDNYIRRLRRAGEAL